MPTQLKHAEAAEVFRLLKDQVILVYGDISCDYQVICREQGHDFFDPFGFKDLAAESKQPVTPGCVGFIAKVIQLIGARPILFSAMGDDFEGLFVEDSLKDILVSVSVPGAVTTKKVRVYLRGRATETLPLLKINYDLFAPPESYPA